MALEPTGPAHMILAEAEPLPFVSLKLAIVEKLFNRTRHEPLPLLLALTEIVNDCPHLTVEGAETEIPSGGGPQSSSAVLCLEYSFAYWS